MRGSRFPWAELTRMGYSERDAERKTNLHPAEVGLIEITRGIPDLQIASELLTSVFTTNDCA